MIFFWTDTLFFMLLLMLAASIIRTRRKEHLRRPWRKVARSKSAMVSLTVLVFYFGFAILDSVHFHPSEGQSGAGKFKTEAMSLLDWWASPLRQRVEKTYSAPFATIGYAREAIRDNNGVSRWAYPRLQYGGVHLIEPDNDKAIDILLTGLKGLVNGFIAWLVLAVLLVSSRARSAGIPILQCGVEITQGRTEIPWRARLTTLLLL